MLSGHLLTCYGAADPVRSVARMVDAMELVTGATGYVGGRLIERLAEEGRPPRALAPNPSRLDHLDGGGAVGGDLVLDRGLEEALDGVTTAYYLVHSMEPAAAGGNGNGGFGD